jgi:hypothetical protein
VTATRDLPAVRVTYDRAAGVEATRARFDERVPFLEEATGVGGIRSGMS